MNRLVHEQSRLRILTMLATADEAMAFTEIRDALSMTAGNLSVQLRTLEEAGYLSTYKYFQDNKPRTDVSITADGRTALMEYLDEMEALLAAVKAGKGAN